MAATIKPIEAKSVHQIQSGQVIVDLCSVVKELVENSLDAGATNIEVRFKNNGLDSIEVQDNGSGISETNYEGVALKHHTSKLSTYEDLSSLQTFGFRGEALSSLCALSAFSITTAQLHEAPRGKRLEFEPSGKLKSTSLVAAQKGSTALVENLFERLPVRRKELSKNIKREYGKVLGLLHAYACISTSVKFSVKSAMPKGKSMVVFSTKGNSTTRENIANVYGAKMLSQLIEVDLDLKPRLETATILGNSSHNMDTTVKGHISKPVFGEGRQTPDRQMFFVNGRPCGLPQMAKAINEVYKSYNVSQSPFIFADFRMNTNDYDVNVSPDKRTIFLHNAAGLLERLKESLTELFDKTDQTVPHSSLHTMKLPAFRQLTVQRGDSTDSGGSVSRPPSVEESSTTEKPQQANLEQENGDNSPPSLFRGHFQHVASTRPEENSDKTMRNEEKIRKAQERQADKIAKLVEEREERNRNLDESVDVRQLSEPRDHEESLDQDTNHVQIHVRDFNERMAEQQREANETHNEQLQQWQEEASQQTHGRENNVGIVQSAFDRMRPRRTPADIATITIGDETITTVIGSQSRRTDKSKSYATNVERKGRTDRDGAIRQFSQSLRRFGASGMQDTDQDIETETLGETHESDLHSSDTEDEVQAAPDSSNAESDDTDAEGHSNEEETKSLDGEYVDESEQKAAEEARVAELIQLAEENASKPSKDSQKRATQALKGAQAKDATTSLIAVIDTPFDVIEEQARFLKVSSRSSSDSSSLNMNPDDEIVQTEEEHLSLTVSKGDFSKMHIAGQFNLGFIIAMRPKNSLQAQDDTRHNHRDELFIIDQHASDEKYNFERLQAETVVGNQRLVHPVILDLTAVEEEIIAENTTALEKNGFLVDMDVTGKSPVGQRCKLVSLPLSREVVFNTRDLDELIHLLAETPMTSDTAAVPRPSKVRKMFAMRACRSSIMIGKTLSKRQMVSVLQHMGSIDKPWNCPHGRPTMRHLISLDSVEERLWQEGDGLRSFEEPARTASSEVWQNYAK